MLLRLVQDAQLVEAHLTGDRLDQIPAGVEGDHCEACAEYLQFLRCPQQVINCDVLAIKTWSRPIPCPVQTDLVMVRPAPGGDQSLPELAQLQQSPSLVLAGHAHLHYLDSW